MEPKKPRQNRDLYNLKYQDLTDLTASWGFTPYHADKIWRELYVKNITSIGQMDKLRSDLLARLEQETEIRLPAELASLQSSDGQTVKYLLSLGDGESIETVLMRFDGRTTACISTQVGCAIGCVFCATGQMGFVRNLSLGEIVSQVIFIKRKLKEEDRELRNVVFMGMGEPLNNYKATFDAVDILTDDRGLAIGPRYITVSTVGLPEPIRRLAHDQRPINLAVSLHAATERERKALVPVSGRWTLDELIAACRLYTTRRRRRIFFEWALIAGNNDSEDQARALGRLIDGIDGHVNLIPINPTAGYGGLPSDPGAVRKFQAILAGYGIPSTVRQRRGIDIQAGCGQLRANRAAIIDKESTR